MQQFVKALASQGVGGIPLGLLAFCDEGARILLKVHSMKIKLLLAHIYFRLWLTAGSKRQTLVFRDKLSIVMPLAGVYHSNAQAYIRRIADCFLVRHYCEIYFRL